MTVVLPVADPCYQCRAPKNDIVQAVLDQEKCLITHSATDSGCVLAIAQAGRLGSGWATSLTRCSERDCAVNFTLGNFGISAETAATRTRVKSW